MMHTRRPNKTAAGFIILIGAAFCLPLAAADKPVEFRNIMVSDSLVTADILIRNIFEDDLISRLRKGMTAAMEYQIQLWEKRDGWADRLICEKYTRIKLSYDPWLKTYQLFSGNDDPLRMTEDSLRTRCANLRSIQLIPEEGIKRGGRYFIAARAVVHPMSMENVDEIKRWLSGEAREFDPKKIRLEDRPGKRAGSWIVRLFLNVTGFGDRVLSGKSGYFGRDPDEDTGGPV